MARSKQAPAVSLLHPVSSYLSWVQSHATATFDEFIRDGLRVNNHEFWRVAVWTAVLVRVGHRVIVAFHRRGRHGWLGDIHALGCMARLDRIDSAPLRRVGRVTWRNNKHVVLCLDRLGLLAGFIGSKLVNKSGEGLILDILLGVVGAIVGGWLFNTFGAAGVTGLNLYSLLVAVIGAMVVLMVYHAIRRV
jgi:uncharacterized membrane protein YeaQ/YmgE (transglycosylase-associated protein family)